MADFRSIAGVPGGLASGFIAGRQLRQSETQKKVRTADRAARLERQQTTDQRQLDGDFWTAITNIMNPSLPGTPQDIPVESFFDQLQQTSVGQNATSVAWDESGNLVITFPDRTETINPGTARSFAERSGVRFPGGRQGRPSTFPVIEPGRVLQGEISTGLARPPAVTPGQAPSGLAGAAVTPTGAGPTGAPRSFFTPFQQVGIERQRRATGRGLKIAGRVRTETLEDALAEAKEMKFKTAPGGGLIELPRQSREILRRLTRLVETLPREEAVTRITAEIDERLGVVTDALKEQAALKERAGPEFFRGGSKDRAAKQAFDDSSAFVKEIQDEIKELEELKTRFDVRRRSPRSVPAAGTFTAEEARAEIERRRRATGR